MRPVTGRMFPSLRGARWRHGAAAIAAGLTLVIAGGIAIGEWKGWPWFAPQVERWLSSALDREVRLAGSRAAPATDEAPAFELRLVGGIRLRAAQLEIAAPAWSSASNMVLARDLVAELRYIDLWRAYRGQPLRVHSLQAARLDGTLERLPDGRASWQFGAMVPDAAAAASAPVPSFGSLRVAAGTVRYRDALLAIDVEASLSLADRALAPDAAPAASATAPQTASELQVAANGRYRGLPLKATLASSGVMPWAADEAESAAFPVTLQLTVGRAALDFVGTTEDASSLRGLSGRFTLKGPSLAAVGDPLGVTLPTTAAFRSAGTLVKEGDMWNVVVGEATVGASRVNGAFTFDAGRDVPLLSGRLGGSRLLLVDLGPVIGTTPVLVASPVTAVDGDPAAEPVLLAATTRGKGKVLPDRPFDLPALRAMDANVLIDIAEVDLDTGLLEPLKPLHAHLQLSGGVLTLGDLQARTGEGRLTGKLRLDGREATAVWNADLRWDGIRLERWIRQGTAAGTPDYVAGRLSGRAVLEGKGRSTAQILASLKGEARSQLRDGSVSHVAVEALGLDVAQGLGVLVRGDAALTVQCAVADVAVERGVFKPRVMVLDTKDSVILIDGTVSLAIEALDLRVVVTPKDFSLLALRSPLHVQGSLADPTVAAEPGPVGLKAAAAIALAFIHPLAALIPFIDPGDADAAKEVAANCRSLVQRGAVRRAAAGAVAR